MTSLTGAGICSISVVDDDVFSQASSAPYAETVTKSPHPLQPPHSHTPPPPFHSVDPTRNNGSDSYAETLTPGFTKTNKVKGQRKKSRAKGRGCYPCLEDRALGDIVTHCKMLHGCKRKLKIWTKRFTCLLIVMVVLWMGPVIPLAVRYPFLLHRLKRVVTGSGWTAGLEGCGASASGFKRDLLAKCGVTASDLCSLDVHTALCLLKKTKDDLDNRTTSLDKSVYEQNRKLTETIAHRTASPVFINNISATYNQRPSVYLHLYYSHENRSAGQSGSSKGGYKNLLWTRGKRGQETVRGMEVNFLDQAYATEIKAQEPGYYYVYSQVTYEALPSATTSQEDTMHYLCKTDRKKTNNARSLVEAKHVLQGEDSVSYLQGVFMLRQGDSLWVKADLSRVNKLRREDTFFGAFLI